MTPDESSLQELAARLARIEQENAELQMKLAHLSTDSAAQATFNQPEEAALSTKKGAPAGQYELESPSAGPESKPPASIPASLQSLSGRKQKRVRSMQPSPAPGSLKRRPGRSLFLVGMLLLLAVLLLLSREIFFAPHSASTGLTLTPAPNSGKPANLSLSLNAVNTDDQIGNLLIQSTDGFQCPYASIDPLPRNDLELGHLVLASDQTTYSQAEIAQMHAYLSYYIGNQGVLNGTVLNGGTEPPTTLQWVLGGEPAALHGISGAPPSTYVCGAELKVTNTGNTPIQISKAGVQLKARPQQNTYQYHLIDVCTFEPAYCLYPGSGGGGGCSVYFASVQLGAGKPNDVFSTVPTANSGCSTLTIPPAAQVSLDLSFSLAPNIPQNLVYSVIPVFITDTTQGEQTLAFPQLESTLAFASASQFSCYGLRGTTFVLEKSLVFSLYAQGPNPPPGQEHWCL